MSHSQQQEAHWLDLLKPLSLQMWSIGHQQTVSTSHDPVLLLLVNPCDAGFFHLLLDSSSPGVLWSASIPLSLRVPLESSSGDVVSWFPQHVSYPCPSPSFEQDFSRFLVHCFPQFNFTSLLILLYHLIPRSRRHIRPELHHVEMPNSGNSSHLMTPSQLMASCTVQHEQTIDQIAHAYRKKTE